MKYCSCLVQPVSSMTMNQATVYNLKEAIKRNEPRVSLSFVDPEPYRAFWLRLNQSDHKKVFNLKEYLAF